MAELYLYNPIYSFIAEDLISKMEKLDGEDIVIRVNSPGGSVPHGWGIIAKMQERTGKTKIKVDGFAMSMAAFMLLFADEVTALDVSSFMLHRADMYVESEEDRKYLANINKDLRKKMESRINSDKLKEITGFSIADLFDGEKRMDAHLTAKQAKEVGLVDKVTKVNPKEVEAFNLKLYQAAAEAKPQNSDKMNIETLKADHPALYAQVFELGKKDGVAAEQDRVGACLAFIEIDQKGVVEAIKSGKPLTQTQIAEFSVKALSGNAKKNLEADSEKKEVSTGEAAGSDKAASDKESKAFIDSVKSQTAFFAK